MGRKEMEIECDIYEVRSWGMIFGELLRSFLGEGVFEIERERVFGGYRW